MRKSVNKMIFVLLFCICMCGSAMTAFAATEYVDGYLRYTATESSVTITGYNGRESEVTVPSKIAGVPVNTIAAGAFSNAASVTKVNLPDTIMTIEEGAFAVGQTVVYNSNTDDAVAVEPTHESTEVPAASTQNTEKPVIQPFAGNSDNSPDSVQPSVMDKVTEPEKEGSVEEVDVEFEDSLKNAATENSMEASENEGNGKEQDISDAGEMEAAGDTETKESGNKLLLIVAGIAALAAAGICIYRKNSRR